METRGDCDAKGGSGENGCFQYLDSTWDMWSKEILGYNARMNFINEKYIAVTKINQWLREGYTEYEVALKWNGGTAVEKKGINKHGVAYDTKAYALAVISNLNKKYE